MARRKPKRYSLERLLRVLGEDLTDASNDRIATMAGTSPRQVQRWRDAGGMCERHADAFACRVWLNAEIVWPEFAQA